MSRKYLLDCSANGAKWAGDVHILGLKYNAVVGIYPSNIR